MLKVDTSEVDMHTDSGLPILVTTLLNFVEPAEQILRDPANQVLTSVRSSVRSSDEPGLP